MMFDISINKGIGGVIPPILTSRHLQVYLLLYKKNEIDFIILY